MKRRIKCSVVGARGYAGLETARLLLQHPHADLTHCFATSAFKLSHLIQNPAADKVVCLQDSRIVTEASDVVFLATPAEVSMRLAPALLEQGRRVIDLSGAFRLKSSDYSRWYGFHHDQPRWLASSQYGLAPLVGPESAQLVANPGCYATAISLALIPVVQKGLIQTDFVVIDAKSGATGAGKKVAESLLYSEVVGECLPYKVGRHQHYPEIQEAVASFAGVEIDAHLTTSLLPVRRGIIAGIYAHLSEGAKISDIASAFTKAYSDYPLLSHGEGDVHSELLSLKRVVGTGRTHISYFVEGRRLYLFSCIDNLLKGAASQAVEDFNRVHDLPLPTGIEKLEAMI